VKADEYEIFWLRVSHFIDKKDSSNELYFKFQTNICFHHPQISLFKLIQITTNNLPQKNFKYFYFIQNHIIF